MKQSVSGSEFVWEAREIMLRLRRNGKALYVIHGMLFLLVIALSQQIKTNYTSYEMGLNLSMWNKCILSLLEVACLLMIKKYIDCWDKFKILFNKKSTRILFAIIMIGVSCSICLTSFFMSKNFVPWTISLQGNIMLIVCAFWVVPLLLIPIYILSTDIFCKMDKLWVVGKIKNMGSQKFGFLVFLFSVFVWTVWLIACNPANTGPDTFTMLDEAMGVSKLTTWFSVLYILFMKLCYSIIPHISFIAVVQIVMLSVLNACFFSFFKSKWKNSGGSLFLGVLLVVLLPANALMVNTVLSNTAYGICVLTCIYLLMRFVDDSDYFNNIFHVIVGALCVTGVFLFRNEGVVVAILIWILLGCLALRRNAKMLWGIVALSIILVCLIRGPLYSALNVESNTVGAAAGTSGDMILATVYFDGQLPDDVEECLLEKAPLSAWKEVYLEYELDNTGEYYHYLAEQSNVFDMALRCAINNPGIAIRERLTHTSFVWEILEPLNGHHSRCVRKLLPEDNHYGYVRSTNILTKLLPNGLYIATLMFCVTDSICYRGAISLIICFLVLLVMNCRRDYLQMILFVPILGIVITQVLAQTWQGYRHIWPITLGTIYIWLFVEGCFQKMK